MMSVCPLSPTLLYLGTVNKTAGGGGEVETSRSEEEKEE